MNYGQSATNWIVRLGNGDESAIEEMFSRYFERLIRLATRKMRGMEQVQYSSEDVAISAVKSFCVCLKEKKLSFETEDDLWACLFRIATRKSCAERRRTRALKRGGAATTIRGSFGGDDENERDVFQEVAGREPSPELALELAERADELLAVFGDQPTRRQIVALKLQGATNEEIAEQTGLVRRTVFWHLQQIRLKWSRVKELEYLFENIFAGFSPEYLASSLDWAEDATRRVVERALTLANKSGVSDEEIEATRLKFFEPNVFAARLADGESDSVAARVALNSGKTAARWTALAKTEWFADLNDVLTNADE